MARMSNVSNDIEIRGPRDNDHFPDDVSPPRPDEDSPRWRRSQIAVIDGWVVGTASVALSPVTDSYFCEINVTSPCRRRGIGTQLYRAIYGTINPQFPVLARAMSSQPLRRKFVNSLGCSVLVHCPQPWIDPTSQPAQQWIANQNLPRGYTTVAMDELPIEKVGAAWARYFDWAHRPFTTVHTQHLPQMWSTYSEGVNPHFSKLTLHRSTSEIVAFSLVTPAAWDGRTMILSETVTRSQPDGVELLQATVAASLRELARHGARLVELEGHTTDPHSPGLLESLPPGQGDPMDILKLAAPPR